VAAEAIFQEEGRYSGRGGGGGARVVVFMFLARAGAPRLTWASLNPLGFPRGPLTGLHTSNGGGWMV